MNALKHGLYAETMDAMDLLERSAGSSYEEALDRMRQHYGPKDGLEEELVRRIARCLWRLRLASMMEERILTRNPEMGRPGTSYEKIMKYERLVDIHLHRAIETLARKRDADNRNRSRNELYPRSP